ncbi:hydrogenase nickel incorporation protein HypB [Parafrankia sp. FMc2]|uniref:hydrogenase nickel incorporation protein HypB n=1 Tax=Parafrankia sp. FMc2 TaxID=3233196 RepID=UPI003B588B0D
MCGTCGCDSRQASQDSRSWAASGARDIRQGGEAPSAVGTQARTMRLELDVLARNDEAARANRAWLAARRACAVNLMSSPGAGKTTLLEHTIPALAGSVACAVVEGDQETPLDAQRIRATGAPAYQVNTGTGCHLEAATVGRALRALDPPAGVDLPGGGSVVLIENVGNLVCPGLFDLGESARVVLASVTEGEDKPCKYPHMFRAADLILLTKVDLLPCLAFDGDSFSGAVRQVNPSAPVLPVSATDGTGLADWLAWLRSLVDRALATTA